MHFLLLNSERVGLVNVLKAEMNIILYIKQRFFSAIKVQNITIVSYCTSIFRVFCISRKIRYGQKSLVLVELSMFYTEKWENINMAQFRSLISQGPQKYLELSVTMDYAVWINYVWYVALLVALIRSMYYVKFCRHLQNSNQL